MGLGQKGSVQFCTPEGNRTNHEVVCCSSSHPTGNLAKQSCLWWGLGKFGLGQFGLRQKNPLDLEIILKQWFSPMPCQMVIAPTHPSPVNDSLSFQGWLKVTRKVTDLISLLMVRTWQKNLLKIDLTLGIATVFRGGCKSLEKWLVWMDSDWFQCYAHGEGLKKLNLEIHWP